MTNTIRIVCVLLIIHHSQVFSITGPFGSSVETGSSLLGATQRKSGLEYVNLDNQHSGRESNSGFVNDESGSHTGNQDILKYEDQGSSNRGYNKGSQSLGRAETVDEGRNSFGQRNRGHYKKGYHRTGFTNNYHKDESGRNSSFYEDSDDEGGQNSVDDNGSYYGRKSGDFFRDGSHDAMHTARDGVRQEIRDNINAYNDQHHSHGGYGNNHDYDNRNVYLHDGTGRRYGKSNIRQYHQRDQFHPTTYADEDYAPWLNHKHLYDSVPYVHYANSKSQAMKHARNDRYFPEDLRLPWQQTYYPENAYHNRYNTDFYNGEYMSGYRPLPVFRKY